MRGIAHGPELRLLLMHQHEQGRSLSALSREAGIPRRVLSRWWMRYQQEGEAGLKPRSRRPQRSPRRLAPAVEREILRVRRARLGPARIALAVGVSPAAAYRVLLRHARNHLIEPAPRRVLRYEKDRPGELLHLDLKYLPELNVPHQEYEFAAIDDFSREAVAAITGERSSRAATAFLEDVLARLPYPIEAVLTDNDLVFTMRFAYYSKRQTYFQQACHSLGIEHRLLRPHCPESNGKVERFIKTVDEECFAVRRPRSSKTRMRVLEAFLWFYNHQRPHLSLRGLTPVQRRENYFQQAGVRLMS
jgi:transposase InsO family protein